MNWRDEIDQIVRTMEPWPESPDDHMAGDTMLWVVTIVMIIGGLVLVFGLQR